MPDSTEFTHPTSPTFGDTAFTPVPRFTPGKATDVYLGELDKYLADQFVSIMDMQASLTQGWIVDGLRVINLTAQNITSETIFTQDLYVGEDSQLELSGTTDQILVRDDNGTTRLIIGNLGSGATEWGIKVIDSSGTVKFQSSSATFIDGAIITNATISDSKIVDVDGSKLTDGTVSNSKLGSISANKITLSGTLTCTTSGTAINVTAAGKVTFSAGGDIIMKSTTSDTSFLQFQTSSGSARGTILYRPSDNEFTVRANGGANLILDTQVGIGGDVRIESADAVLIQTGTGCNITMGSNMTLTPDTVVVVDGNLRSASDNVDSLGTASLRWADVRSVLINGADFCFENGFRMTEPNHVYLDGVASEGVYFMNEDWEPIALLTRQGNLLITGYIQQGWIFPQPDYPKRIHDNDSEGRQSL